MSGKLNKGRLPDKWREFQELQDAVRALQATANIPLVSSLPPFAIDGQEVYFFTKAMAAVDAVPWRLRYRDKNPDGSPNTNTHKWDVVGRAKVMSTGLNGFTPSVNGSAYAQAQLAGDGLPVFVIPVGGVYDYYLDFKSNGGATEAIIAWMAVNGVQLDPSNILHGNFYASSYTVPANDFSTGLGGREGRAVFAAGDVVTVRYSITVAGNSVAERFLRMEPHRVG